MELPKQVRQKTVEEVFIEKATIIVFKPPLTGAECACHEKIMEPAAICRECYGTGILGGFDLRKEVIPIEEAAYEEIEKVITVLDTTKTDHAFASMDDWVLLTFECPLHSHIYSGCIFELNNRFWKVTNVEEECEEDAETGVGRPYWEVQARKLHEYEPAYIFLDDKRWKGEEK